MYPQKIQALFYEVDLAGNKTFEQALVEIAAMQEGEPRQFTWFNSPYQLQELKNNDCIYEGDIVKVRVSDLPCVVNLTRGITYPLGLADDEGLGESTAFLYNSHLKVLVLQKHTNSAPPSLIASYVTNKVQMACRPELIAILTSDAYSRLRSMEAVESLQMDVAGLNNLRLFENEELETIAEVQERLMAPKIQIKFEASNPNRSTWQNLKSLSREAVNNIITTMQNIATLDQVKVNRLSVKGSVRRPNQDEPQWELVDFLKDRLRGETQIQVANRRHVDWAERRTAINTIYHERLEELTAILGQPKDG